MPSPHPTIWKKKRVVHDSPELKVTIWDHDRNCSNNSDKFLVNLNTPAQNMIAVPENGEVNDYDYCLPSMQELPDGVWFIVVGCWELNELIGHYVK